MYANSAMDGDMSNKAKLKIGVAVVVLFWGMLASVNLIADAPKPAVRWQQKLMQAHKVSVATNKPLMLVFTAEWCTHCRQLENETLSDAKMVKYVNDTFVPIHVDLDKNRRIAKILEVKSVPCTVVLSPEADLLGKLTGNVDSKTYFSTLSKAREIQDKIQLARAETSKQ